MPGKSGAKQNGTLTRKAFQYRLYPTKHQEQTLRFVLRRGLNSTTVPWKHAAPTRPMRHTGIGYTRQAAELAEIKAAFPAYQELHRQVLQDVLRRVDNTFAAFFRRVANGEKPGYPRFKRTSRSHSFTYPQSGFALAGISGKPNSRYALLTLAKMGDVKVRLHRPMQGQVKTCTIKRDVNHW